MKGETSFCDRIGGDVKDIAATLAIRGTRIRINIIDGAHTDQAKAGMGRRRWGSPGMTQSGWGSVG